MSFLKKKACGITLRCCGAVVTGCAVVCTMVIGLAVLGGRDDAPRAHMAQYKIRFPENEQMLKDMSDKLMREAHATTPATTGDEPLQDIQPAAGGDQTGAAP
jgi:hypothetical protein